MITIASDGADERSAGLVAARSLECAIASQYAHLVNNMQSHVKIDAVYFPA
jgi:hypothetical protein